MSSAFSSLISFSEECCTSGPVLGGRLEVLQCIRFGKEGAVIHKYIKKKKKEVSMFVVDNQFLWFWLPSNKGDKSSRTGG